MKICLLLLAVAPALVSAQDWAVRSSPDPWKWGKAPCHGLPCPVLCTPSLFVIYLSILEVERKMYIFIIRQTLTSDTTVMHTHPPLQICKDDGKMAPQCQVGMKANTGKRGTYTYVASNNINFRDRGGRRRRGKEDWHPLVEQGRLHVGAMKHA